MDGGRKRPIQAALLDMQAAGESHAGQQIAIAAAAAQEVHNAAQPCAYGEPPAADPWAAEAASILHNRSL